MRIHVFCHRLISTFVLNFKYYAALFLSNTIFPCFYMIFNEITAAVWIRRQQHPFDLYKCRLFGSNGEHA